MQGTVEKEKIAVNDLIDEVKILLPDYFECEITSDSNSIIFNFYNTQSGGMLSVY